MTVFSFPARKAKCKPIRTTEVNNLTTVHVLFIGAGRMARAMIAGIRRRQGPIHWDISVANHQDSARLTELTTTFRVRAQTDWRTAAEQADIIILAMPPAAHQTVLETLSHHVLPHQLVASVAAGIGVSGLASKLPEGTQCAWLMPNIAAAVGESMTLCAFGDTVTADNREKLAEILRGLGQYHVCTETQVHHLTAITGSAPAFAFQFAEALEQAATALATDETTARLLVGQMLLGSAKLLLSGRPPEELTDEVATPGGATAAGLSVLTEAQFKTRVMDAIEATNQRARALAPET